VVLDNEYDSFLAELNGDTSKSFTTGNNNSNINGENVNNINSSSNNTSGNNGSTEVKNLRASTTSFSSNSKSTTILAPIIDVVSNRKQQTIIKVTTVMTGNTTSFLPSTSAIGSSNDSSVLSTAVVNGQNVLIAPTLSWNALSPSAIANSNSSNASNMVANASWNSNNGNNQISMSYDYTQPSFVDQQQQQQQMYFPPPLPPTTSVAPLPIFNANNNANSLNFFVNNPVLPFAVPSMQSNPVVFNNLYGSNSSIQSPTNTNFANSFVANPPIVNINAASTVMFNTSNVDTQQYYSTSINDIN
jgi:hypothetical protein